MKLAVYQFAPDFGEKEANLRKIQDAVSGIECDLLVLPELALTGYQFISLEEIEELSENVPDGTTCEALGELACETGGHVICGLAEKAGDEYFNCAVLVGSDGVVGRYRKAHLFMDEKKWFAQGDSGFEVFDIGTVRVGVIICFDWLFPEVTRILALRGAQVVVQPANLILPWCQQIALARAWENKVYFVTTNRTGSENRGDRGELRFTGQSQVVTPSGELLFRLGEEESALKIVEIEPTLADDKSATELNDIFKDRRLDLYGPLLDR